MNDARRPSIITVAKLHADEESRRCDHCGRQIRKLVELSTGKTVGYDCALKALGYSRHEVESAAATATPARFLAIVSASGGQYFGMDVLFRGEVCRPAFDGQTAIGINYRGSFVSLADLGAQP